MPNSWQPKTTKNHQPSLIIIKQLGLLFPIFLGKCQIHGNQKPPTIINSVTFQLQLTEARGSAFVQLAWRQLSTTRTLWTSPSATDLGAGKIYRKTPIFDGKLMVKTMVFFSRFSLKPNVSDTGLGIVPLWQSHHPNIGDL